MTVRLKPRHVCQIRPLIPNKVRSTTETYKSEIQEWLTQQNIQAVVSTNDSEFVFTTDIDFVNPRDETWFRLKYSEYIQ